MTTLPIRPTQSAERTELSSTADHISQVLTSLVARRALLRAQAFEFWHAYLGAGSPQGKELASFLLEIPHLIKARIPVARVLREWTQRLARATANPVALAYAIGSFSGASPVQRRPRPQARRRNCRATFEPEDTNTAKDLLVCGFNNIPNLVPPKQVVNDHPSRKRVIESQLTIEMHDEQHAKEAQVAVGKRARIVSMKRQSPRKTSITVLLTGVAPSSVPYKKRETRIRVVWNHLACGDFPIKIVIPHKRGLTVVRPANDQDPKPWENYFVRPRQLRPRLKDWTRRTRKPTILPAIVREDQGVFFAAMAMFMVRTEANRVMDVQILDQYGDPIHRVYETSSKGWIVSDERFEPVENKRFFARGHMGTLAGTDGWIQHKSHGKKGKGLNENGIWPDQVGIDYPYPVFSRPFGARLPFRLQSGRFVPANVAASAAFDKAQRELGRASRLWSRKSTNTFWAFLNEALPRQPGAKQKELLEGFRIANEGSARMYLRFWGHTLKGSVVRTVKVTPAKRNAPTFVMRDE